MEGLYVTIFFREGGKKTWEKLVKHVSLTTLCALPDIGLINGRVRRCEKRRAAGAVVNVGAINATLRPDNMADPSLTPEPASWLPPAPVKPQPVPPPPPLGNCGCPVCGVRLLSDFLHFRLMGFTKPASADSDMRRRSDGVVTPEHGRRPECGQPPRCVYMHSNNVIKGSASAYIDHVNSLSYIT